MSAKLDWIDVLNEQFEWNCLADVQNWYSKLSGSQSELPKTALKQFHRSLNFIRDQVSNLHFNEPVDIKQLDKKIDAIKLSISADKNHSFLPLLHAGLNKKSDLDLLVCIEQTLLFQFAQFISDFLSGDDSASINRCEGLYKEQRSFDEESLAPVMETEKRWRKEIPLMVECKLLTSADIHRCGDFFVGKSTARFCSESCRFRTFQLNKQLTDPDYLADKQRRYRDRKK